MTTFTYQRARKVVVIVIGATLLLIGVAMLVLPGPGLLVLYLGLLVLASEFVWAQRWLKKLKGRIEPLAKQSAGFWHRLLARWERPADPPSKS